MKTKFTMLIIFFSIVLSNNLFAYIIEDIDLQINDSLRLTCQSFLHASGNQAYFWSIFFEKNSDGEEAIYKRGLIRYYNNKLDTISLDRYDIDSSTLKISTFSADMVVSKNGNKYFIFDNGYLLQFTSDDQFISYKQLFEDYNIPKPNSVAVDDDENIYLHANGYLYKIKDDTVTELISPYDDYWKQPNFQYYKNLYLADNKLYYKNLENNISFYDIVTGDIGDLSLKIKDRLWDYMGTNYPISYIQAVSNKFLNLTYGNSSQNQTIVNYYPENDSLVFLDDVRQALIDEGYNTNYHRYYGVDNKENYYYRIFEIATQKESDTLYIINDDLFVRKIYLGKDFSGFSRMNAGVRLDNDDIINIYTGGLVKISGVPSSVEDYTNWLFLDGVYPNPARDYINVDFSVEPINLPNTKVKIYDYIGREVSILSPEVEYNNSTGMGKMTCDISDIQSGFYILVITNDKYSKSTPIYIE